MCCTSGEVGASGVLGVERLSRSLASESSTVPTTAVAPSEPDELAGTSIGGGGASLLMLIGIVVVSSGRALERLPLGVSPPGDPVSAGPLLRPLLEDPPLLTDGDGDSGTALSLAMFSIASAFL